MRHNARQSDNNFNLDLLKLESHTDTENFLTTLVSLSYSPLELLIILKHLLITFSSTHLTTPP